MKKPTLPRTDSIRRLADFRDRHDLTDFEHELEEVREPVFARRAGAASTITVPLKPRELRALARLAKSRGVSSEQLVGTGPPAHHPAQSSIRFRVAMIPGVCQTGGLWRDGATMQR